MLEKKSFRAEVQCPNKGVTEGEITEGEGGCERYRWHRKQYLRISFIPKTISTFRESLKAFFKNHRHIYSKSKWCSGEVSSLHCQDRLRRTTCKKQWNSYYLFYSCHLLL